jgi:hypothetical protein
VGKILGNYYYDVGFAMKKFCLKNNYQVEQIETKVKSKGSGAKTIYIQCM